MAKISDANIRKEYDTLQRALGGVTMAFGQLDELMRDVICELVNHNDRGIGYVVFDLVASSLSRRAELIKDLIDHRFSVFNPITAERWLEERPPEYEQFASICTRIRDLGEERNRAIHGVYKCWVGQDVRFDTWDLKKAYRKMLSVERRDISAKDLDDLTKRIHETIRDLKQAAKMLLTRN